jgi:hypothetical protein
MQLSEQLMELMEPVEIAINFSIPAFILYGVGIVAAISLYGVLGEIMRHVVLLKNSEYDEASITFASITCRVIWPLVLGILIIANVSIGLFYFLKWTVFLPSILVNEMLKRFR